MQALYCVAFILVIEVTTQKYTTIVSNLFLYMYVLGEIFALIIAFFGRDWHITNWTLVIYSAVTLAVIGFFIPESPRFLFWQNIFTKKTYHDSLQSY